MTSLILSVIGSVAGGLILVIFMSLISQRARWVLTGILGRLLDVDIEFVFSNKAESLPDLKAEIARARQVAILTGRGNELQRETFSPLFLDRPDNKNVVIRILLPETAPSPNQPNWTNQRERELAAFDHAYGNGLLVQLIEANAQFLANHAARGLLTLRRYNSPHIGRLVITERFAYYTPYRNDCHGRDSCVYKFRRGGEMYDNLGRLFDQLWLAPAEQLPGPEGSKAAARVGLSAS
jgi:hypothetical protein